ncbi:hypothetical protein [Lichenihabitans psoromatis]|uniref:hypothetical protein n=1 Tax=Lichenihabitans psoromatis TaxID=2528642 RepID=UPI00103848D2|nr:hypothetical protein [Lichenihabitans psoromatis]
MTKDDHFFISIDKDSKLFHTFDIFPDEESVSNVKEDKDTDELSIEKDNKEIKEVGFSEILQDSVYAMNLYLRFSQRELANATVIGVNKSYKVIYRYVRENGSLREDLSSDKKSIYQLNMGKISQFKLLNEDFLLSISNIRHLPQVMIMGLISSYDHRLARMLKLIFNLKPEMIFTSDKEIKFSDLVAFKSIDEAKNSIIEREVEAVIRLSHRQQFDWMHNRFSIKLRENLPQWSSFIEVCERRNLFTHTGGIVSNQYIEVCSQNGGVGSDIAVGKRLTADGDYVLESAISVSVVLIKLSYVLWRKFIKDEYNDADRKILDISYEFIFNYQYKIAGELLKFSIGTINKFGGEALNRQIMVINLANTIRLQGGDREQFEAVLSKEDWSGAGDRAKLCVAAVRGDIDLVASLMKKIGLSGDITAENYRTWPVFRGVDLAGIFGKTFEEVFGEAIISSKFSTAEVSLTNLINASHENDTVSPTIN